MTKQIIELFKKNEIDAFEKYPQGKTPMSFITIKNTGLASTKKGVNTNEYLIEVYTRNDIEEIMQKITTLLLIETLNFSYCGNPVVQPSGVIDIISNYKKQTFMFKIDKVRCF